MVLPVYCPSRVRPRKCTPANDMFIILIAIVSVAALAQFALFYWRAWLAVGASAPISEGVRQAAGLREHAAAGDFGTVSNLHEICPELGPTPRSIGAVRMYYNGLARISRVPALKNWVAEEMAVCSRFLAARLEERIAHNRACWAQVRAN